MDRRNKSKKNYRNQGIATHLLKYMVKYGNKKGLDEACALVSYNNVSSKKLFEKQKISCIIAPKQLYDH